MGSGIPIAKSLKATCCQLLRSTLQREGGGVHTETKQDNVAPDDGALERRGEELGDAAEDHNAPDAKVHNAEDV